MPAASQAGPGHSQELEIPSGSSTWVAGTPVLVCLLLPTVERSSRSHSLGMSVPKGAWPVYFDHQRQYFHVINVRVFV